MSDELIERVAVRIVRAVVGHSAPISGARVAAHNLHAAGLLATPTRDAAVAAKAWDEGFARGFYTGTGPQWGEGSDASEPDVVNPYEREGGAS